MHYIFVDESGDLGRDSNVIVISGILIKNNPIHLENIIKKTRKTFRKQLNKSKEIKANETDKEIKKFILNKVNNPNSEIYAVVLFKKDIYKFIQNNNKNSLYNNIAKELAKLIPVDDHLEIRIDYSKNKSEQDIFNKLFIKHLNNPNNYKINIYHNYSENYKGLQVADVIAWSIFQKYENNNEEYEKIIENKNIKRL